MSETPRIDIADLTGTEAIEQVFLLSNIEVRQKKNGEPFLNLELADRSGRMQAKVWDNADAVQQRIRTGDYVRVRGQVKIYNKRLDMTVQTILAVDDKLVDKSAFVPRTRKDIGEMARAYREIVNGIRNEWLKTVLRTFVEDEEWFAKFCESPAAVRLHHACIGGLLEHVLTLSRVALAIAPLYPMLDRDLLLTGIFLHDVGKVRELSSDRAFAYTDEGRLMGHITIGAQMLEEVVRGIQGFPEELRLRLQHMILSHHGEFEYGSPVLPATMEAVALHHIDNIDAKIYAFDQALRESTTGDERWTEYNKMFDRYLFKGTGGTAPAP
ncbi:MAG: HD domain-containing protein [Candidatus Brocadiae bacterium]|nr:HD domain-containing protein [Candidatus Brocadiia bacterium]